MLVAEAELAEHRQQLKPESVQNLLEQYYEERLERGETNEPHGQAWRYLGTEDLSVELAKLSSFADVPIEHLSFYNSTVPFIGPDGKEMQIVRGEPSNPEGEEKCFVAAFRRLDDLNWEFDKRFKLIEKLQDPSYIHLPEGVGISGVEIWPDPVSGSLTYRKNFYFGPDIYHLSDMPQISGSNHEKGQVIKQRSEGKITVFTRPTGGNYRRGRVGIREFDDLSQITGPESFKDTLIIAELFGDDEWGGVDQVLELSDGGNRLLVIGHIARFTDDETLKHYYAIAFVYDADTGNVSDLRIIATRADFPEGPIKSEMLEDIVYPRGIYLKNGRFMLVVGISDMENGELDVTDRLPVLPNLSNPTSSLAV